jgi:hypothetical protein
VSFFADESFVLTTEDSGVVVIEAIDERYFTWKDNISYEELVYY